MGHDNTPPEPRWFNQRLTLHLAFWLVVYSGLLWFLRQDGWPVISRGNVLILFLLLPIPVYLHFHLIERFFNRRYYPLYIILTATMMPGFAALFRALFSARMRQYNGLVSFVVILGSFLAVTTGLKFSTANINNRIAVERDRTSLLQNRLEVIGRAVSPGLMLDKLRHLHRLSVEKMEALPSAILDLAGHLRTALNGVKSDRTAPGPPPSDSERGEQVPASPPPPTAATGTSAVIGGGVRRRWFFHPLAIHACWWLLLFAAFFYFLDTGAEPAWRIGAFLYFFTVVAAVDLNFYFLDRFLKKRRILLYGASAALVIAAYTLYFQLAVIGRLELDHPVGQTVQDTVAILIITTFARLTLRGMGRKLQLERIQSQQKQIELDLMTSRVNPHFLFNTLNNLYSLSLDRSPRLPGIIEKLSRLMAYMFEVSEEAEVPLNREVDFLGNYLDLEKLRLPEHSDIRFSLEGEPGDHRIAPMLFIPLVENCFKHGRRNRDGALTADIRLKILPRRLMFSTHNIPALGRPAATGTGLANLRRRLELLYEKRHKLNITPGENQFECIMEIRE